MDRSSLRGILVTQYKFRPSQVDLIMAAIDQKTLIIIDGRRNRPTGKSTLCDTLRENGVFACEGWEIEEGGAALPAENYIYLGTSLNEEFPFS